MLYAQASYIFWLLLFVRHKSNGRTYKQKTTARDCLSSLQFGCIYIYIRLNVQQLITHGGIEAGDVTWAGKLSSRIGGSWWPAQ